ncbi:MAG: hypothetical protein WKF77_26835 [Planctomycetaceae bacterium]
MSQIPPAKAPTGPKVSGTRTIISLVFLGIVLIICGIEVRAGLGQFLTLRSYNKVSENGLFKNVSFDEAQGMVAAFPSKSDVQVGEYEDLHHYYWYSLLRPLMGDKAPELYVSSDHSDPAAAVSFYTSMEGEAVYPQAAPGAPAASGPMTGAPMGMGGPPGMGGPMGMGGTPGGGRKGGKGNRPPLEDAATDSETIDPAATDRPTTEGESGATPTEPAPTEPAPTEPAPTEPNETPEPAAENPKSETPAAPN